MGNHAEGDSRVGRIGYPPNQAATAIRDRFQKWQGRYLATCARLDEAMQAIETAIRDQWWGRYQAWDARFREQQRQPARYSLIGVQYPTTVAKWLLGLSGAGTVWAFGFYAQSYLSVLSIKNDCASLLFVAHAMTGGSRVRILVYVVRYASAGCHCLADNGRHWAEPSTLVQSPQTAAATAGT